MIRFLRHLMVFIGFLLWASLGLNGQELDSIESYALTEIAVLEKRDDFKKNHFIKAFSQKKIQELAHTSLGNLLAQNSGVYVRSYGIGSLATSSIRGTSSSHTAVLWNGFNLQSPMNGNIDLSLIPNFFLTQVQLQTGGNAALFGSGAMGGVVHLNHHAIFQPMLGFQFGGHIGSFGDYQEQAGFFVHNKKQSFSLKAFHQQAQNDFKFKNTASFGSPIVVNENAALRKYGLLAEHGLLIKGNQVLNQRIWLQNNHRQIPGTMTTGIGTAYQIDRSFRYAGDWKIENNQRLIEAKLGYFNEYLLYADSSISLHAKSRSTSLFSQVNGTFQLGKNHSIQMGIHQNLQTGQSDAYAFRHRQNRIATFLAWNVHNAQKTWVMNTILREELVGSQLTPLTFSWGTAWDVSSLFQFKGNVSRNYRSPTFNDLFWFDSGARGNPLLKAESGWSEDIGGIFKYKKSKNKVQFELAFFNKHLSNQIVWLPESDAQGNSFWQAQNRQQIWTRGIEQQLDYIYKKEHWNFQLSAQYQWSKATNLKLTEGQDHLLGKQSIFNPMHKGQIRLGFDYLGYQINYQHALVGKRFITSDNSDSLPIFHKADFILHKRFQWKKWTPTFQISLNNIWNTSYQEIAYRPMPGRHFLISMNILFSKKTNKQ